MFTETDRDAVQRAILDMAKGKRVFSLTTGDRSVSYTNPTLGQLEALLARISKDIGSTTSASRVVHLRTCKNL